MKTNPVIWALLDGRAGNVSQVTGLAERLDLPVITKDIKYNQLACLPNFIRRDSLLGIDTKQSGAIEAPFPDIVIAAGRRSAPVSLYIKRQNPASYLVHIMNPNFSTNKFDLVILPEHDQPRQAPNIITSLGALHKVTDAKLDKEKSEWQGKFANLPKPHIAVIVGGSSKNGKFTEQHGAELGKIANTIANDIGGSLLITTSRRTDDKARAALKERLLVPYYFYDFNSHEPNPYMALLALSDIIIVTGDSISMCSEACYTGKPVYIYSPEGITGKKHKLFHEQLYTGSYARNLNDGVTFKNTEPTKRLDEAGRIAMIIKQNFSSQQPS